jgi:hypothetical protein
MRFDEADTQAVKKHFSRFSTKHDALLALVPVVAGMEKPKQKAVTTKPLKIGLPTDFIRAAKRLKQPMTKTIIAAIERYERENGAISSLSHSEEMEK